MASEKLPWDLVEEILSWVPLRSLARFKTVCKRWNTLFEDNIFTNNQLTRASRPQFILFAESNIFSVDVILNDCPSIEVQNFPLDIPGYRLSIPLTVDYCDGLLLCDTLNYGLAVCSPWLKQTRWNKVNETSSYFSGTRYQTGYFNGIRYDSSRSHNLSDCGIYYYRILCQTGYFKMIRN